MFDFVEKWFGTVEGNSVDSVEDDKPCTVSGHNWVHKRVSGYYTEGVPHFGGGDEFVVARKDYYECSKCEKPDFRRTTVGKVAVDKDTDELTIKQ